MGWLASIRRLLRIPVRVGFCVLPDAFGENVFLPGDRVLFRNAYGQHSGVVMFEAQPIVVDSRPAPLRRLRIHFPGEVMVYFDKHCDAFCRYGCPGRHYSAFLDELEFDL